MQLHLQGAITQADAAKQLEQSEGAFRIAYMRFRKGLAKHIQLEVSKLVGPDKEAIKSEIQYFMSLLPDGEL